MPSFNISLSGNWPKEVYNIIPVDYNKTITQIKSANAENIFRFVNNPVNDIDNIYNIYKQIDYNFGNSSYVIDEKNSVRKLTSSTSNNTFSWNVSSIRSYNVGSIFNYLVINFGSSSPGTTLPTSSLKLDYRSYLLYPQRLFLYPISLSANPNGTFNLRTSTVFLSATTFFIESSSAEYDAYNQHNLYTSTIPRIISTRGTPNRFDLIYSLSAVKNVINNPLINFTQNYNPVELNIALENPTIKIRPDSTFVKFANSIKNENENNVIAQNYTDEFISTNNGFRSSFIENYNFSVPNFQTFQLVQSSINTNLNLEDIQNCVLSTTIDLNVNNFRYNSFYYIDDNNNIVNALTGLPDSSLELKYIAESPEHFNNTTLPIVLTTTLRVLSGVIPLNVPINNGSTAFDNVVWTILYPPHYYSFKTSFQDSDFKSPSETSNLNFTLSTYVIKSTISSINLSSCISSDFNILNYDLPTYAKNDYISLKTIDVSNDNLVILNTLSCLYGNNVLDKTYDLINSPFVPASAASQFLIVYPDMKYGEFDLTIRTSLSSLFFDYVTDSPKANILNFAKNISQKRIEYPISLNVLNEKQDEIDLTCSHLVVYPEWPSRDLRDSLISWNYTLNNPASSWINTLNDSASSLITLTPIDSAGNSLTKFPINSAIPFDYNTWSVKVSGYGPNAITITLSSQKYNEIASVSNNTDLFDYLSEKKFIINPLSVVNDGKTTKITLAAAVPVNGKPYAIPSNLPIYWSWKYDNIALPEFQPVSAFYLNGSAYSYGEIDFANILSSLNLSVELSSSSNSFNKHDFNIYLNSQFDSKSVYGECVLTLQDYPDSSIFNTDFTTTYFGYSSLEIANTRNGKNVITRPISDLNKYVFYSNSDVTPILSASRFQWTITDSSGYSTSVSSTRINNISSIYFETTARSTTITLSAIDATIKGWLVPHDIKATTTIYNIPNTEFYNPTRFLIYPPYTWQNGNLGYLTLLNSSNYTLAQAPTAYANKTSLSQDFYVSANKIFNIYEYGYGSSLNILTPETSSVSLIDIPYNNEIYSNVGVPIALTAYNDLYPKTNGITYTGINSTSSLYTGYFSITAKTNDFNNATFRVSGLSAFYQSPKIIPYDTLTLKYSAIDTDVVFDYNSVIQLGVRVTPVTAIDLDNNIFVGVIQTISPINTANSPVRSMQDFYDGMITYSLSSKNWIEYRHVPAFNGIFDLFVLDIGDATKPFTVSPNKFTPLVLAASAVVPAKIPASTFGLYLTSDYSGSSDLWSSIDQNIYAEPLSIVVYSTSVKPEIFVSSYYNLTGEQFTIEFETPENTQNLYISSYKVYFGDGNFGFYNANDVIYHSYDAKGIYTLSYDVTYNTGETKSFSLLKTPITVLENWPIYDQSNIRLLTETTLSLPWDLDQIYIQPNEFGDADIFNNAITRLYENLEYLKGNIQTINTDSPTLFYGWLGTNQNDLSRGIEWHSLNYNSVDQNNTHFSTSSGISKFSNIIDIHGSDKNTFVLDGTTFRAFSAGKTPKELFFDNLTQISQLIPNPVSISVDDLNNNVYIADSIKNKIYKLNLSFDYINLINIQLTIGNFGKREDPNKFNAPSEVIYIENNVFVLDYNNLCIKQYTQDLNWIYTYYSSDFQNDRPVNFAIHPTTLLPYILSENYNIFVFDNMGNVFTNFRLNEVKTVGEEIKKITFDEGGDFFYVITTKNIFKYSIIGTFISLVNIPNGDKLNYSSAKYSNNRTLLCSTPTSILKFQDVVTLFKVGEGLPYEYWTKDQLMVYKEEFTQDITYNRALTRLVQNIKSFRNIMDSRFVITTEQTNYGTVKYFAKSPIAVASRPVFSDDIENETVKVGVNEFNIPQVLNRELKKIYDALSYLASYLSITDIRLLSGVNTGCTDPFCWSWKSMSCYNLSLPVIRICNINPITYAELESSFPIEYSFAPSNTWDNATAPCCDQNISPLG